MPGPIPPTVDADGYNLDPRNCDCGKGSACPLVTPEWRAYLAPHVLAQMNDAALAVRTPVLCYVVVDVRDGAIFSTDADGYAFADKAAAERFARSRNDGLFPVFQTYRVAKVEQVPFADVKPRTGALAE